jgi:hypothetical protein
LSGHTEATQRPGIIKVFFGYFLFKNSNFFLAEVETKKITFFFWKLRAEFCWWPGELAVKWCEATFNRVGWRKW